MRSLDLLKFLFPGVTSVKDKKFHITIGVSPSGELNLENDLQMLKAAILYADRVKLCSLTSSMIMTFLAVGELNPQQQLEFLEALLPGFAAYDPKASQALAGIEMYKKIDRKKRRSKNEILNVLKLQASLIKQWNELRDTIYKLASEAGANGISDAITSGMVEVHIFMPSESSNDTVREFFGLIEKAISDGSTYPLFDDATGQIVSASLREGKMSVSELAITRGKNVALASHLFDRLPLFDFASINEILDIRRELERHLIRFRAAMLTFSDNIKSASWDTEFSSEAELIFYREVQPVILEIEDAIKSNRYLAELTRELVDKPFVVPSGSALAFVISKLHDLPELTAQALCTGASAATIAYDTYKRWKQKQLTVEQNQLFFYYKTGKRLKKTRD